MIQTLEQSSYCEIYSIDLNGIHPDQELEDYFAVQLNILIGQELARGLVFKAITMVSDKWVITFGREKYFN